MKNILLTLFSILIISLLSAQTNNVKVLFIGNSFTSFNNMPDIFKKLTEESGRSVKVGVHAPGGATVGDTAQGDYAHSANPAVYNLIRSEKWDYVVIQDNQGRFVLDSAVFPASSDVVNGHLMLRDSIRTNNSCSKVIWFAGWAYEDGSPPYGNTGIEMIKRILINYRVMNDTAKDIISPIGEAWIKTINNTSIELWSSDGAHPSVSGSYLTASTVFTTIFRENPTSFSYTSGLDSLKAKKMRQFSYNVIKDTSAYVKYNLGGIKTPDVWTSGNMLLTDTFVNYKWYSGIMPIQGSNSRTFSPPSTGNYHVLVQDSTDCWLKSCEAHYITVKIRLNHKKLNIYPNPVSGNTIFIEDADFSKNSRFILYDNYGKQIVIRNIQNSDSKISLPELSPGMYIYRILSSHESYSGKLRVLD